MTNLASFLLGSLVTIICAGVPFFLSSQELRRESARLRHLLNVIVVALETNGLAEVKRDSAGEIVGIVRSAVASAKGTSTVRGAGEAAAKHE